MNNLSGKTLDIEQLRVEFSKLVDEFFYNADIKENGIIVLGCSTSEICGNVIGKGSSSVIGNVIIDILYDKCNALQYYLAVQCCEHLNRALVIESKAAEKYNYSAVYAVPHEKAGGSVASIAFRRFLNPILIEYIQADAGIDIGDTFIGMHLKPVVVPIRLSAKSLGKANITFAKTRPKFIGGERAKYSL